jgi:hypothetical protein
VQRNGTCYGMSGDPIVRVVNTQADLQGLRVGLVGSAKITGRTYVMSKVSFQPDDFDTDAAALKALRAGSIQAYLTMAAWPAPVVAESAAGTPAVKLVSWTGKREGVYSVVTKNYKALGQFGVPFLSVPNLLLARPVDPTSEAGRSITKLKGCLSANLGKFKDTDGFVPSWDDVVSTKAPDDVPAWQGN